jgi:hypothetical protein
MPATASVRKTKPVIMSSGFVRFIVKYVILD